MFVFSKFLMAITLTVSKNYSIVVKTFGIDGLSIVMGKVCGVFVSRFFLLNKQVMLAFEPNQDLFGTVGLCPRKTIIQ